MAAKKKRSAGITARKKRSKASKKAQKKAPSSAAKKRGKKKGKKTAKASKPAPKIDRRPAKVAVRGKAVVRKKRKQVRQRPITIAQQLVPPTPPKRSIVRKKKKAKRGPLSIAEIRAIRSDAAKVGWKKRHKKLEVKRKEERDRTRAEALRQLEIDRDRRGFERMQRLLEKQHEADIRASKRREKLAQKAEREANRIRRERERDLAIERRRIQRGERIIERMQEATGQLKEAVAEQQRLNQFKIPEGYTLSEGSYVRQRMDMAEQTGMESYEAQLLAEELEESVSRIWTTWKSPRNELAIA